MRDYFNKPEHEMTRGDLVARATDVEALLQLEGWEAVAEAIAERSLQIQMGLLNSGPHEDVGRYERSIGEMRGLGMVADIVQGIIDMGLTAGAEAHLDEAAASKETA
tara:strand:+ start:158 stop:478 length:321 start_codon:yes stop_codon:yes gene_type:complete